MRLHYEIITLVCRDVGCLCEGTLELSPLLVRTVQTYSEALHYQL